MADRVIYVSENEATRDFASVLEHVRAGAEVVIESASDKQPLAVMHLPVPAHRAIPECIALAKEHQEATGNSPVMDADFARDVEAAVASHREPREPSAWEQATNEVARLLLENRNGTEDWGEISHLQGMPCPKRVANEFLLCCLLDFQIPTNTAWDNGHRLVKHILGDPDDVWSAITSFSEFDWAAKWGEYRLHRFPFAHKRLWRIGKKMCAQYGGDARNIWEGKDSAAVLGTLEALGAGDQISRMIVGGLRDSGQITGSSHVKADSHVCRVLGRAILGTEANPAKGGELARQLCPGDPWQLDWPLWNLAKDYCSKIAPACSKCYLRPHCAYAAAR